MRKFDFLTMFGDEPKQETVEEKIARIEKALSEKDAENTQLKAKNEELQKTVNSIKLDAITKKVEPAQEKVEDEDIQFDFDV